MCRLCLFNNTLLDFLGKDTLEYHFAWLEEKQGGDGMGVAALWPSGKTAIHKSTAMGPREAVNQLFRWKSQGATEFIFHTRMATFGSKTPRNCHPFKCGGVVLAHNGSDNTYSPQGDRTDSETILRVMVNSDLPTEFLDSVYGVFIGFRDRVPFVVKGQTQSSLWLLMQGDAFLYTSDIQTGIKNAFDTAKNLGRYQWLGYEQATTSGTKFKGYTASQAWEDDYWYTRPNEERLSKRQQKREKYRITKTTRKLLKKYPAHTALTTPKSATITTTHTTAIVPRSADEIEKTASATRDTVEKNNRLFHAQARKTLEGVVSLGALTYETRDKITSLIRDNELPYDGFFTRLDIGDLTGLREGQIVSMLQALNYLMIPLSFDELERYYRIGKYSPTRLQQSSLEM